MTMTSEDEMSMESALLIFADAFKVGGEFRLLSLRHVTCMSTSTMHNPSSLTAVHESLRVVLAVLVLPKEIISQLWQHLTLLALFLYSSNDMPSPLGFSAAHPRCCPP